MQHFTLLYLQELPKHPRTAGSFCVNGTVHESQGNVCSKMRRETFSRPNYQPFQTTGRRCHGEGVARIIKRRPMIREETRQESTRTALEVDSRSYQQRNKKTAQAREKMPCITQEKLMRNLTRRGAVLRSRGDEEPHPRRNVSRKINRNSSKNCEQRSQLFTEERKTGSTGGSSDLGNVDFTQGNNFRAIQNALSFPEQKCSANYLPPLTISSIDTHNGSTYSRLLALAERRQFDLGARVRLNWKRMLTRGDGFHPNEAREIPTAGEVALQRSKTWERVPGPPVRAGKLAGARLGRGNAAGSSRGRTPFYTQGTITVITQTPLTTTHHIYCVDRRLTESRPQTYWPKSGPTPPPVRWSYATGACLAPPVTPSSPVLAASPTRQRAAQSVIDRRSALESIAETTSCLVDKDEGIGTPSTEDSIDGWSCTGLV